MNSNSQSLPRAQQDNTRTTVNYFIDSKNRHVEINNPAFEVANIMGGLYGDGIIGLKSAFDKDWVKQLDEDIRIAYDAALKRPGGAVGRGPQRHYVEIHPEDIH